MFFSLERKREIGIEEILSSDIRNVIESSLCGSRVTCVPIPEYADLDVLILVRDKLSFKKTLVSTDEWEVGGSFISASDFMSFTKGELNLIVTDNPDFYRRFMCATRYATKQNILIKDDRIALFQAILYGNG